MIVGITGYVGSGKSTFIKLFMNNFNAYFINTDDIAKEIIKDSPFIYVNDNAFLNKEDAEKIKNEIHPKVWQKTKGILRELKNSNQYKYIILETALPTEPFFDLSDLTICIKNDLKKKITVLKEKRNYTDNKTMQILDLQKQYDEYYQKCDILIENNGDVDDLEKQILKLKENNII